MASPETFYPDAHPETTSVDGSIYDSSVDTWAGLRGDTGTVANDAGASNTCGWWSSPTPSKFYYLYRGFFLFDTSPLPDICTITNAVLSIRGVGVKSDQANNSPDPAWNIFASNPASDTALIAGDFDAISRTPFSDTNVPHDTWADTYNDWIFNAAGLASISKTDISKYSLQEAIYDAGGATPNYGASGNITRITNYCSEEGAGFKPKLVVTYTGGGWTGGDLNGVANASIAEVNGVAIADIAGINGVA